MANNSSALAAKNGNTTQEFANQTNQRNNINSTQVNRSSNILNSDKNNSKRKKETSSLKYFNYFLLHHYTAKRFDGNPTRNYFRSYEEITMEVLRNYKIFGEYANYLAKTARTYYKETNPLISFKSAQDYLSAVKNYFLESTNFKAETLPALSNKLFTKYYHQLLSIKKDQARAEEKPLIDSKDFATEDKMMAIAVLCFWEGTLEGIDFFALNKCMYNLAARTCEVLDLKTSDITVKNIKQDNNNYDIIRLLLNRNKTTTVQNPQIFAHRDTVVGDVYFGLFAKLALCQKVEKHLFLEFAKSTMVAGGREQGYKSKASNVWSKYYDKVTRLLKKITGK